LVDPGLVALVIEENLGIIEITFVKGMINNIPNRPST